MGAGGIGGRWRARLGDRPHRLYLPARCPHSPAIEWPALLAKALCYRTARRIGNSIPVLRRAVTACLICNQDAGAHQALLY